jgi:hypothetical protein
MRIVLFVASRTPSQILKRITHRTYPTHSGRTRQLSYIFVTVEPDIPTHGILDDTGTRKLIAIKARSLNLIAVFDL